MLSGYRGGRLPSLSEDPPPHTHTLVASCSLEDWMLLVTRASLYTLLLALAQVLSVGSSKKLGADI